MPFIGQSPLTGAYHVLDAITTSATATYNLQLNSGAYSPASANNLLVSLNGVIQKPGSSFTISGSQITFSSALTSTDSIDFIIALGDVLSIGTPTDGTVTTNKIANSAVTNAKIAGMAASKLTGAMPALDGSALTGIESFTRATIDLSSVESFTGLPSTTEIIHLVITNASSSGNVIVRLRAGGNIVSSNYFTGLDYRYTAGSNSWTSAGGANYTQGIAMLGNWGSSTLNNAVFTILRNHSSSDSNPSFHASGLVFYRNYGTHGGAGRMIGLNTGLGAAFDGLTVTSSDGSMSAGKATIYYR